MIYPSVTDLLSKTGSRYALVIATAKRAREIASGDPVLVECDSKKPVTIALNEIHEGVVEVYNKKTSPKVEAFEEPVAEDLVIDEVIEETAEEAEEVTDAE